MSEAITEFIARWGATDGLGDNLGRENSKQFLTEFCDALGLPRPEPAQPINEDNAYSFERAIRLRKLDGTSELRKFDLYRKSCFAMAFRQCWDEPNVSRVRNTKRSSVEVGVSRCFENAMQRTRYQAERCIRCLPVEEGRPPYLIVADAGRCFDIYSEFTCTGGLYVHFPSIRSYRIWHHDLARSEIRDLFRAIWFDPHSLDPLRRSARATEEIAGRMAVLARGLEAEHAPEKVSQFLLQCIFLMFAEAVGFAIPGHFQNIIETCSNNHIIRNSSLLRLLKATGKVFPLMCENSLQTLSDSDMFAHSEVLPLDREHIAILLDVANADWKVVEPAIFGTLVECALDPKERHKLGAHYTPRAFVERLVIPTVVQPLRREWENVQTAACILADRGKEGEACTVVAEFLLRLRGVRVLDPACGSGNFLYVTMEHMKRIESEVLSTLAGYGKVPIEGTNVGPHQFLGLEISRRASRIAEMVLWIGYLQWQWFWSMQWDLELQSPENDSARWANLTICRCGNIQNRDALINWKGVVVASCTNDNSVIDVNREAYMGASYVSRQNLGDDEVHAAPKGTSGVTRAEWPKADFIVGNPPFIGDKRMRATLDYGYAEALRSAYPELPESCDFVMYWWHKAAELTRTGNTKRFGFITTNSLTQIFNHRVVAQHITADIPLRLVYAIADHPWIDTSDAAAVRIAMTVGERGTGPGVLAAVVGQAETQSNKETPRLPRLIEQFGVIHSNLRQGPDISRIHALTSNRGLCSNGVELHGLGFAVTRDEAASLGLGSVPGLEKHIRPYRNGRDIARKSRDFMVIDLLGLTLEDVQTRFPAVYQWIYMRVKPRRDANNRKSYRDNWWLLAEPRKTFRPALANLTRYISTFETAKHRVFVFMPAEVLPDHQLVSIASADAFHLGVLSCRIHICWAFALGGQIGTVARYNKSRCFDTFPFPEATATQMSRVRDLGEKLDSRRSAHLALHPEASLTELYNVLDTLRTGRKLTNKEQAIRDCGFVRELRSLHDQLDQAVFDAYGWPSSLSDREVLSRLATLNAERAEEESRRVVRWLRPEYQRSALARQGPARKSLAEAKPALQNPPITRTDRQPFRS